MEPSFYTLPPAFPRIREKMRTYQPLCNGRSAAVFPIGRSLLGRGIYAVRLGNSRRFSLFVGGVHGQEWLTVLLLFRFLDDLFSSIAQNHPLAEGLVLNHISLPEIRRGRPGRLRPGEE